MIEVIRTAPLNTVQDRGRAGFRYYGIASSGAMDDLALRLGNALLGNDDSAAGIEFQMFPAELRFQVDTLVAITGAGCHAKLNDKPLPGWWVFAVKEGDRLEFLPPEKGARAYLTVLGGVDVPLVLSSRATSTKSNFGGFQGRALREGDLLPVLPAIPPKLRDRFGYGTVSPYEVDKLMGEVHGSADLTIRMMLGAEFELFTDAAKMAIFESEWRVSAQSNRQGYRLAGDQILQLQRPLEMRSYGLIAGVVQVPPSGQPIIQLAECNATGGYPKIGNVIAADLWKVAQAPPGTRVRFRRCDLDLARQAWSDLDQHLRQVRRCVDWLQIRPKKAA